MNSRKDCPPSSDKELRFGRGSWQHIWVFAPNCPTAKLLAITTRNTVSSRQDKPGRNYVLKQPLGALKQQRWPLSSTFLLSLLLLLPTPNPLLSSPSLNVWVLFSWPRVGVLQHIYVHPAVRNRYKYTHTIYILIGMGYGEIFKYKIYYVCIYSSIPITYPHTHIYVYACRPRRRRGPKILRDATWVISMLKYHSQNL